MASSANPLLVENLLREMEQIQSVMRQRKIKPPPIAFANQAFGKWQNRYQGKFLEFVHDCISFPGGKAPYEYQDETLSDLAEHKRVAQYGLHGFGKTTGSAWIALAASLMWDDAKIITTASVWRQLSKFLWPEIHKWSRFLNWKKIGREPYIPKIEMMTLAIKRSATNTEVFAVASNQAAKIEGAHASTLIFIYDEAKIIPDPIWDSSEGAFSTQDTLAYALASSTPGAKLGRFYDICSRKKGYEDWHVNHIETDRAVKAGAVSQKWLDDRARQWGEESPLYKNRCLGEFADDSGNNVIPLSYIERAVDRYESTQRAMSGITVLGVDVARFGDDKSVIAVRRGNDIVDLLPFEKLDTMELVGWVVNVIKEYNPANIVVDVIGLGAGVLDRLKEMGYPVVAFNASEHTDFTDKSGHLQFTNRRGAAWWRFRELLEEPDNNISLPNIPELIGELSTPCYKPHSSGKMMIEGKDEIRSRLHRSTDYADAVIMSYMIDVPGMTQYYDTEVSLIQYQW